MTVYEKVEKICLSAKNAAPAIAHATTKVKNDALACIAKRLSEKENKEKIIAANAIDLACAASNGVPVAMLDRLKLDSGRIDAICSSLYELIKLPDPIGSGQRFTRPSGIEVSVVRAPLGVIGIIFESRPNVTVDAAALCLKTGNAVVLRGGKEAINSNIAIVSVMRDAIEGAGLSPDIIGLVDITDREGANALMSMKGIIDVLIPRGGKGLIRSVVENARVPVIETGAGNCHLYVDGDADIESSVRVAVNAKCSRPSVCNAIETLLVSKEIAKDFLPAFREAAKSYNIEYRTDSFCAGFFDNPKAACEEDWYTEYNDFILAVKAVENVDEAITHINKYGTGHSDAIMTRSLENAERFQSLVDSAAVYVNASTRFTDGGEFGFGAEMGISTQKLHVRGPMGLMALTTEKYLVRGNGTIR